MKKIVLIPIIVGSALLITGGIIFAVGLANAKQNKLVSRDVDLSEYSINGFDFDIDTADVTFKVSTDSNKTIAIKEYEKQTHSVEVKNNVLSINGVDKRKWYDFLFNFNFKSPSIEISLPAGEYANLKIKNSTGDIDIPKEFTFQTADIKLSTGNIDFASSVNKGIDIKTSTGDISYSGESCQSLTIKTSTGNVNIKNSNIDENLNIEVDTGHVLLKNVKCENAQVETSTGWISLEDTLINKHLDLKTSTGDVKFTDSDAETIKIKTSTGDVKGTLLTSKIFAVSSSTGKINVPVSTEGGLCEISTSTGDVIITIKG